MEFSVTERGARKLLKNGYQYVKQKDLANGVTSWECTERRKGNCKAKVFFHPTKRLRHYSLVTVLV